MTSNAGVIPTKKGSVQSTRPYRPVALGTYVAVETEDQSRQLECYFKSGSGKAFAKKRYMKPKEK